MTEFVHSGRGMRMQGPARWKMRREIGSCWQHVPKAKKLRMFRCDRPGELAGHRSKFCQLISTQQYNDTVLINLALTKKMKKRKQKTPLSLPVDSVYKLDMSLAACHQTQRAIGVKESATTLPFHYYTWYSQNLPPNADSPDDLHRGSTEHYRENVKARRKLLPIILWKLTCQDSLFHLAPERWVRTRIIWERRHVWFRNQ